MTGCEFSLTVNALAGTDLVLPLGRHDFSVGARDVDASIQASLVVSIDDIAAEDLAGADTAVVWALGGRETVLGPAIRPALEVEECVFLLKTEPELVLLVCFEQNIGVAAEVVGVGLAISSPGLAHDNDIVT